MVVAQIRAGDRAGAARTLQSWQEALPEDRRTRMDRAEMTFASTQLEGAPTVEQRLEALEAFRRDRPCAKCVRVERADWLAQLGRTEDARAELRDIIVGPEGYFEAAALNRMPALERLGALAEEAGDRAEAADAYRRFVEMWKDADAAGQPRLRRAQERLAALGG
jgi:hypothetical protein